MGSFFFRALRVFQRQHVRGGEYPCALGLPSIHLPSFPFSLPVSLSSGLLRVMGVHPYNLSVVPDPTQREEAQQ